MKQQAQKSIYFNRHLTPPADLRDKADDLFKKRSFKDPSSTTEIDPQLLPYELQVRQMELEIQNEELKTIQEKLHAALKRYEDLYNSSPVGYFTLDLQGRIIESNVTGVTMLRSGLERLTGEMLIDFVAIEDRPVFERFLQSLLTSDVKQQCDLQLLKDREPLVYAHLEGLSIAEDNNNDRQIRLAVSDITERKRTEMMMLAASRLEATATLAGGIAHDFNNMMTVILGNAELIDLELAENPDLKVRLSTIVKTALRASELTQMMLAYARGGKYTTEIMDLNESVQDILNLLNNTQPELAQIKSNTATDLWKIKADPRHMNMVVMSLLLNAIEALDDFGGFIVVSTSNLELDQEDITAFNLKYVTPGRYVCLGVDDTGRGMTPDIMDRVFEPFFTTKFQGRGMGLAAAYGIVKNHQGYITVTSEPDYGSQFTVYLPAL